MERSKWGSRVHTWAPRSGLFPGSSWVGAVSILFLSASSVSASPPEFSGIWSTDCDGSGAPVVWIIRGWSTGLYQVGYPRIRMSEPTSIVEDDQFEILGEDRLIYRGREFIRCIEQPVPDYDPVSEDQIRSGLPGRWKVMYKSIAGKRTLISEGRSGVPDLEFLDDSHLITTLVDETTSADYEVEGDQLSFKIGKGQRFRVLRIDGEELHLGIEERPSEGVLVFQRD